MSLATSIPITKSQAIFLVANRLLTRGAEVMCKGLGISDETEETDYTPVTFEEYTAEGNDPASITEALKTSLADYDDDCFKILY